MKLRLKTSEASYELQEAKSKKLLLKAEWVKKLHFINNKNFSALTLTLKNSDGSIWAETYLKPKKSILRFEWNNQNIFYYHNHTYTISCANFLKKIWMLKIGNDCYLYKKGFLSLKSEVFKNEKKILLFNDDLVSASKGASPDAIKIGVTIHLIFNKPWNEVVF